MSADNGIYILQTKECEGHQYRVTYASAIDNLGWSYKNGGESTYELVPTRVIEFFGGCKFTRNQDVAFSIAGKKLKSYPYVEYGIQLLKTDKSWSQIVREARVLAVKELAYMKSSDKPEDYYKYDIESLEHALDVINQQDIERKNLEREYNLYLCKYGLGDLESQTENHTMSFKEFVRSRNIA